MLKDNLYYIKEQTDLATGRAYRLTLDASHPIFMAHFAGNPVMPAACIVQLVKELTSDCLEQSVFVRQVKNAKFLKAIDPLICSEITVELTTVQAPSVSAILYADSDVLSKITLLLTPAAPSLRERIKRLRLCVIVPTYNHRKTLPVVLNDIIQYGCPVIVIDDGSTDGTPETLKYFSDNHGVEVISYTPNRGKGYALKTGFARAKALGYEVAITIDSDGQHFAADMAQFIDSAEKYPHALLVGQRATEGDMPTGNSFANRFSNFWFTVQTAYKLRDTQNGFRLYPLSAMKGLHPLSTRYEAELEMLVRSAWRGISIKPVPVRVYYPPSDERITHFRPAKDFCRISLLNALFTLLAIVYGYPSMAIAALRKIKDLKM